MRVASGDIRPGNKADTFNAPEMPLQNHQHLTISALNGIQYGVHIRLFGFLRLQIPVAFTFQKADVMEMVPQIAAQMLRRFIIEVSDTFRTLPTLIEGLPQVLPAECFVIYWWKGYSTSPA